MILGVGSDLVRITRMEESIHRFGDRLLEKIFTPAEVDHCRKGNRPASCFAKRFAAKEALVKALGTGMRGGIWFRDVEVFSNDLGAPGLRLSGEAGRRLAHRAVALHVSLSDDGDYALAFVVIEEV